MKRYVKKKKKDKITPIHNSENGYTPWGFFGRPVSTICSTSTKTHGNNIFQTTGYKRN